MESSEHRLTQQVTLLRNLGRELRISIGLAVGIALFLGLTTPQSFLVALVYSLCISLCIQALISVGRFGMSHQLRRHYPQRRSALNNWPGWPLMAPWVVVAGIAGYYGGHWLADLLTGAKSIAVAAPHDPRALFPTIAVVFMISIGCTYFFYSRGRIAAMEVQAQSALRAAAENQLKLLESQLEPHMLFNTLANLRVLIRLDPPRAEAMLDRLIAFLRATLAASQAGTHSLSAEFARIDDYLELMQVRMGPRLRSRLYLPPELANLEVPPLLLQPLVENAIKHGLEPHVDGGRIEVTARRQDVMLVLTVRDTGVGLAQAGAAADGTHFGMRQVRDRLATLYGSGAALALAPTGDAEGGCVATVHLPIQEHEKTEKSA
ncbi:MAG: histidine kinase [Herminiimonas sp.]|nr:histidine kinase [Herminiimonas sp.]